VGASLAASSRLKPHLRLWFSGAGTDATFGDGRWRLLEALTVSSSLRAVADDLGISYRKAWGDLRKAEECLGVKLMERRRGGKGGGETTLTPEGERWLNAFRDFRNEMVGAMDEAFDRHFTKPSSTAKG
jgi:molybdate transport system regulatory protein